MADSSAQNLTTVHSKACASCAKRKVRCDRQQPCSNCRRRKQDRCVYPEESPFDRIHKLESLVRELGGDPEKAESLEATPDSQGPEASSSLKGRANKRIGRDKNKSVPHRSNEPMILEEDGETVYIESPSWASWIKGSASDIGMQPVEQQDLPREPILAVMGTDALTGILSRCKDTQLFKKHPPPHHAEILWNAYRRNAHPLLKICFEWELDRLQSLSTAGPESLQRLSSTEFAFVFAVYLLGAVTMSDDDCSNSLHRSKSNLISELQVLCEQALAGSNFLCPTDLVTLQAITIYISAGLERLSTKSLWVLSGLALRSAESMGLHRDGTCLKLSPLETERRRRLWWQLLHLDLSLGVGSGTLPLVLEADWDVHLPLNIEDSDIDTHMTEFPKERKGLTSMSHCLWGYWVILDQRSYRAPDGRLVGCSWTWDKSISYSYKVSLLERLESGLNEKFLQFCDPIRPLDVLIQHHVRFFISAVSRLMLLPLAQEGFLENREERSREELLDVCLQCLEYDIALHSHPSIQRFRWRINYFFQWKAFVCVLLAAWQRPDTPRADRVWDLLPRLYAANTGLLDMPWERRKTYGAKLVIAAWKTREGALLERNRQKSNGAQLPPPQKPAFVSDLESRLSQCVADLDQVLQLEQASHKRKLEDHDEAQPKQQARRQLAPGNPFAHWSQQDRNVSAVVETMTSEVDMSLFDNFQLDDVDWSFWDGLI